MITFAIILMLLPGLFDYQMFKSSKYCTLGLENSDLSIEASFMIPGMISTLNVLFSGLDNVLRVGFHVDCWPTSF
jgi:hypothetical protein